MSSDVQEQFQPLTVPRDAEGYVQSFDINNQDETEIEKARAFFDQYGFIVFANVYTPEECEATINDIWNVVESFIGQPVRDDESLWTNSRWSRTGLVNEGIIGGASLWTRQILLNRQIPNIHAAFARILRTENLLVNHDRYGLFRPVQEHAERRTMTNLHLDMNPWSYIDDKDNSYQIDVLSRLRYTNNQDWIEENNEVGSATVGELHVQGLVNLADNKEEDGGFWLVPGFHKYLPKWVEKNRNLAQWYGLRSQFNLFRTSHMPEMYAGACHIASRAGSAILWDQRTLHGSRANASRRPRFAQFFKMFPAEHPSMTPERAELRGKAILRKLSGARIDPDTDLTPLGKKIFGIENIPC